MALTPKAAAKRVYSTPENITSAEKSRQTLSASLRERLRRTRRSFTSPVSVAKRLCVDQEEEDETQHRQVTTETVNNPPVIRHNVDVNRNPPGSGDAGCAGLVSAPCPDLTRQLDKLRREVKDKTEILRRLKMVKMYRSKNNLAHLQSLIDKWRSCSQAALCQLQSEVTPDGKKATLSELMDLFGLEDKILHFDRAEDDFST